MTMVVQDADGNDITVSTPEEMAEKDALIATKDKELADAQAKIVEGEKFRAEQTQNFKKLNELSVEERAKLTAAEIESRTRAEKIEADHEALKASVDADKKAGLDKLKEAALVRWSGGDKELREKIEKNLDVVNLADPEEKVKAAAAIAGVNVSGQKVNPLHQPLNGDAPHIKEQNEKKEFLESDKAKSAMAAMGDAPKKKE